MPLTPNSSAVSYASGADLTSRYDWRQLADWCQDADARLTDSTAVQNDPNVAVALMSASGEVEAACLAGRRYAPADLAALSGTAGGAFLVDIVCALAMWLVYRRRRFDAEPPESAKAAMTALQSLRDGTEIFGFVETEAAGAGVDSTPQYPTQTEIERSVLFKARRFFGNHGQCPGYDGTPY